MGGRSSDGVGQGAIRQRGPPAVRRRAGRAGGERPCHIAVRRRCLRQRRPGVAASGHRGTCGAPRPEAGQTDADPEASVRRHGIPATQPAAARDRCRPLGPHHRHRARRRCGGVPVQPVRRQRDRRGELHVSGAQHAFGVAHCRTRRPPRQSDARPGAPFGQLRAGVCDGRPRAPARDGPDRTASTQRTHTRSDGQSTVLQPSAHRVPAIRSSGVRVVATQSRAPLGAGGPTAHRVGRVGGQLRHARQSVCRIGTGS
ncbi:hypothetical protein D806_009350 [Mycolicibacterium smegmatis MKD8]|uniref:Uncharacterized protein n=1 Tax=Mycolicibacterium smegmatis (strain MKD8) TaxID=1214915 RepID=A0A2U9PJS9_MYCSE|nr:hypothetical protein D806_009350 [Mycolicibacterium smegmatis MKD8]